MSKKNPAHRYYNLQLTAEQYDKLTDNYIEYLKDHGIKITMAEYIRRKLELSDKVEAEA